MVVKKVYISDANTSCNFCSRGILSENGVHFIYPYSFVFIITPEKSGIQATICEDCLMELFDKTSFEEVTLKTLNNS